MKNPIDRKPRHVGAVFHMLLVTSASIGAAVALVGLGGCAAQAPKTAAQAEAERQWSVNYTWRAAESYTPFWREFKRAPSVPAAASQPSR